MARKKSAKAPAGKHSSNSSGGKAVAQKPASENAKANEVSTAKASSGRNIATRSSATQTGKDSSVHFQTTFSGVHDQSFQSLISDQDIVSARRSLNDAQSTDGPSEIDFSNNAARRRTIAPKAARETAHLRTTGTSFEAQQPEIDFSKNAARRHTIAPKPARETAHLRTMTPTSSVDPESLQFELPDGFREVIEDITRAVPKSRPENLAVFLRDYFKDKLIQQKEKLQWCPNFIDSIRSIGTISTSSIHEQEIYERKLEEVAQIRAQSVAIEDQQLQPLRARITVQGHELEKLTTEMQEKSSKLNSEQETLASLETKLQRVDRKRRKTTHQIKHRSNDLQLLQEELARERTALERQFDERCVTMQTEMDDELVEKRSQIQRTHEKQYQQLVTELRNAEEEKLSKLRNEYALQLQNETARYISDNERKLCTFRKLLAEYSQQRVDNARDTVENDECDALQNPKLQADLSELEKIQRELLSAVDDQPEELLRSEIRRLERQRDAMITNGLASISATEEKMGVSYEIDVQMLLKGTQHE